MGGIASYHSAMLVRHYNITRLLLLISSEITEGDCSKWASTLKELDHSFDSSPEVINHLDGVISNPSLTVGRLRHMLIQSGIINMTASLEFFLSNIVSFRMQRNPSYFKKAIGTNAPKINPKDLVDFTDIDQLREKYIDEIAQSICQGELWSKKLEHVCKFLNVNSPDPIHKTIDSIWEMRNSIAHDKLPTLMFTSDRKTFVHTVSSTKDEHFEFVITLLAAFEKLVALLNDMDGATMHLVKH